MKKQNIAIIAVVALVLAVAVGYALFSQTINITGTATANGSYDVVWQLAADQGDAAFTYSATCNAGYVHTNGGCGNITNGTGTWSNTTDSVAALSNNNHTLTITIDKLAYPGATIRVPFRVKNTGSIDAKLVAIRQSGTDDAVAGATAKVSGDTPSPSVTSQSPKAVIEGETSATVPAINIVYGGPATLNATLASGATADGYIDVTWNANDESNRNTTLTFWVELDYQQAN